MNRLAHRWTIASLALLAACGGSPDDAPGSAGGGTTGAGGTGAGTTAPGDDVVALEIVEWSQSPSALRVSLILRNQDTLPLPVTPASFSVESMDGFTLGSESFQWITEPCPSVNLASSASLRCEVGFSKSADQEPARLVFAALDGRQAESPFPPEPPITQDDFCSRFSFEGSSCPGCMDGCGLIDSACSSEDDQFNVFVLIESGGDYCPEGVPLLSTACFDELLSCVRGKCADSCGLHP
ncbi:hypothetical protein WMF26_24155 [Sorangium sp. So ce185]|uniref:hypothetical protein n=1 Tax=Sorangium sp. So ce185 TaxID=3133287 RepID=UPI003F5D74E8